MPLGACSSAASARAAAVAWAAVAGRRAPDSATAEARAGRDRPCSPMALAAAAPGRPMACLVARTACPGSVDPCRADRRSNWAPSPVVRVVSKSAGSTGSRLSTARCRGCGRTCARPLPGAGPRSQGEEARRPGRLVHSAGCSSRMARTWRPPGRVAGARCASGRSVAGS